MKYLKILLASAIIIGSGIMDNLAYCQNNVQLNRQLINNIVNTIHDLLPNNNINQAINNILYLCYDVSFNIHFLHPFYIDNIPALGNIQLNINMLNNILPPELNINNGNNIITYNELVEYLGNSITNRINNTVQQINSHINQYKNNNELLKRSIIQELGDLYHSVKKIANLLIDVLRKNLNEHDFGNLTNYHNIISLQKDITRLDNLILKDNDLGFRIIKYPQIVNELERLYNSVFKYNEEFLDYDMCSGVADRTINIIHYINSAVDPTLSITNNLYELCKVCVSFSGAIMIPKETIEAYNGRDRSDKSKSDKSESDLDPNDPNRILPKLELGPDDPDLIKFNKKFMDSDLYNKTGGRFVLYNNKKKKTGMSNDNEGLTFIKAMMYFSNRMALQLLAVIRDIIRDFRHNNYLDINSVERIINDNIHNNIDQMIIIINETRQFIQNDGGISTHIKTNTDVNESFNNQINKLENIKQMCE